MGGPSYTGGNIPFSEHRRKIANKGDVPEEVVDWATFERTHSQVSESGERRWINAKSQEVAETYEKLSQDRASQSETNPASSQSDNVSLFIEAAGGFNKKGRLFGYGASASRLKPTKRTLSDSDGVSADEIKRMRALVQEQATQMSQQQEQIIQQQEQMRRQQEEQEQRMVEQMRRQQQEQEQRMAEHIMQQDQRYRRQESELHETREMLRQMQIHIKSMMKDKDTGSAPDSVHHPRDDGDDAAV